MSKRERAERNLNQAEQRLEQSAACLRDHILLLHREGGPEAVAELSQRLEGLTADERPFVALVGKLACVGMHHVVARMAEIVLLDLEGGG
jgi:hypothetical protein